MRALLNHRTLLCCVVAQLFVVPRASSTDSTSAQAYIDKLRTFSIKVPSGWSVQEYNDPRTKVRFSLPSGTGKIAPSIFIISHSMTMEIDLEREAAMRIDRLRKMNAVDAGYEMVSFAGTHAAQMDATLPTGNIRMRNLMLKQYGAYYTISYTAEPSAFERHFPAVSDILSSFRCLPPAEGDTRRLLPTREEGEILDNRIRVWIQALGHIDAGTDAEGSLLNVGAPCLPALRAALSSTESSVQRERLLRIVTRIEGKTQMQNTDIE